MNFDDPYTARISRAQRRFAAYRFWAAWMLLALFSAAGWMRMVDSLSDREWLELAGVQPGPLYLIISGGLWGAAGLIAVIWLLLRRQPGKIAALAAAIFFAASYWIDRLLFSRAAGSESNTAFALLMTFSLLAVVILGLIPFPPIRALSKR